MATAGYQALPSGSDGTYGRLVSDIKSQLAIVDRAASTLEHSVPGGGGHAASEASREGSEAATKARKLLTSQFKAAINEARGSERSKRASTRQELQRQLRDKLQRFKRCLKSASAAGQSKDTSQQLGGGATAPRAPAGQTQELLSGREVDFTAAMMREREEEAKQLASDMVGLQEVMRDLSEMVAEQGDMVDEAESHTDTALERTGKGVEHLNKAASYQKGFTSKLMWFILILLLLAGGVTAAVVLTHKK